MADARAWLVEKVRAYRRLGFFQAQEDRGQVTGDEPGCRHVPIGLPRPAYGGMPDARVADLLLRHHESEWGRPFDPEEDHEAVRVAESDVDRMARIDTECVSPGADAYVDVVLAMARISRGRFQPADVREAWEGEDGPVRVSFTLDGRRREIALEVTGDYLDEHVVDGVNAMLAGAGWRFERLVTGDQTMLLVALSASERRALEREHGWRFGTAPPPDEAERPGAWSRFWPFRRGGHK